MSHSRPFTPYIVRTTFAYSTTGLGCRVDRYITKVIQLYCGLGFGYHYICNYCICKALHVTSFELTVHYKTYCAICNLLLELFCYAHEKKCKHVCILLYMQITELVKVAVFALDLPEEVYTRVIIEYQMVDNFLFPG